MLRVVWLPHVGGSAGIIDCVMELPWFELLAPPLIFLILVGLFFIVTRSVPINDVTGLPAVLVGISVIVIAPAFMLVIFQVLGG